MVLPLRGELGNRRHRPVEAAQVVAVSVAEPEGIVAALAATGDVAVTLCEIGGVVERAECHLARLLVARSRVQQGIDGSPPRGRAPETGGWGDARPPAGAR